MRKRERDKKGSRERQEKKERKGDLEELVSFKVNRTKV